MRSDKNWELIQNALAAEASGKSPRLFSSRRTLFGIPSALDEELARVCDESSAAAARRLKRAYGAGSKDRDVAQEKRGKHHVQHPFEPVFDDKSRVLILGTIPSPKSRETGFYYNHPQNRFWKVMSILFDEPLPASNKDKKDFALRHNIALWDVLFSCDIHGAKDGSIAQCTPNDITRITGAAPIEAVFCTGAKAHELYCKYCEADTGIKAIKLPSTSAANAQTTLNDLLAAYRQILI